VKGDWNVSGDLAAIFCRNVLIYFDMKSRRRVIDGFYDRLVPGAICEELFAGAATLAEASGFGPHFMGAPGENAKFVGHGVGLELDELPVLAQGFKMPLVAGQTIAIEPKFVFPGRGVVGIENTFAVSAAGGIKITDCSDTLVVL